MTVYVLENSDGVRMGIFLKRSMADRMAVTIGQNRWHEAWKVVPVKTDEVDSDMLSGSESYRKMVRTLEARVQSKTGEST